MSDSGDHVPEMAPTPLLDDLTIEMILDGDQVPAAFGSLAAFGAGVRAVGDGPAPRPSPALAHLLATGSDGVTASLAAPGVSDDLAPTTLDQRRQRRFTLAKVAGLGVVAKVGLAATTAAAGVVGAGAAGMLPGEASRVVRDAIEVVTPVEFRDDEQGDRQGDGGQVGGGPGANDGGDATDSGSPSEPGDHGDRVSTDATGESDGDPGVDGSEISQDAPGASQRPSETPGQDDTTGPPADAGTPPVTVPPGDPGKPADPGSPSPSSTIPSPSSTVPAPPSTVPPAAMKTTRSTHENPAAPPGQPDGAGAPAETPAP